MRLLWLAAGLATAASAQDAPRWASAPADTLRWAPVADARGHRVYVDVETLRSDATVVEVWTWHAYAEARRPPGGAAYDREIARDRVFCRLRMTAPLRVARYLGREEAGAFMYPPDVGPYEWAPGSAAEAVGERVCPEAESETAASGR